MLFRSYIMRIKSDKCDHIKILIWRIKFIVINYMILNLLCVLELKIWHFSRANTVKLCEEFESVEETRSK